MAEVTKLNLEEMLPHIEKSIKKASFIAIDTEFTGLQLAASNEIRLFDSLEERYQKLKSRASNFIPCQIGVSTFKRHESKNLYLVESFVFFVRPCLCGSVDKRFVCQASAMDFLSRYDFDFNKFIKEGLPYINDVEEQQICEEIKNGTIGYTHEKLMDIRFKKKQDMFISNSFLMKSEGKVTKISSQNSNEDKIVLQKDDICHEYFQLNELRHKYPSLWACMENGKIVLKKVSLDKRKELEKLVPEEEKRLVSYFLGFTRVFRLLKEAKKPIVGHNDLMDLLLFFANFYKPLPGTYKEFKKDLHSLFPVLYDTRHIWRHVKKFYQLKDIPTNCGLFDLQEMFKSEPKCLATLYSPDIQHCNASHYLSDEFPHDSGYDSFVTGWVFLKICHVLAMKNTKSNKHVQPQTVKQHLSAVAPFMNKLNIGRARETYIDIGSKDPLPSVTDLLYITKRQKRTILNEIQLSLLLNKYGMNDVKLLGNRTAAVIAVANPGSYRAIMRDFKDDKDFIVTKYNAFLHAPIMKTVLWLTAMGTGCIVAFLVGKLVSGS